MHELINEEVPAPANVGNPGLASVDMTVQELVIVDIMTVHEPVSVIIPAPIRAGLLESVTVDVPKKAINDRRGN